MANKTQISIKIGNDYSFPITADTGDAGQDFTGWSVTMMVKRTLDDGDDAALITKAGNLDPTTGVAVLQLTAAETRALAAGNYHYDIRLLDNNGVACSTDVGKFEVDYVVNRGEA